MGRIGRGFAPLRAALQFRVVRGASGLFSRLIVGFMSNIMGPRLRTPRTHEPF